MKMKRIVAERTGGPDVLHLAGEVIPEPGSGEVRVKVLAAGDLSGDLFRYFHHCGDPTLQPPGVLKR